MKRKAAQLALCFIAMSLMFSICKDEDKIPDRVPRLEEPEQWELAQKQTSVEAYEAYVAFHPRGTRVNEAKAALVSLWDEKVKTLSAEDMNNLTAVIETNYGAIKFKFYASEAPGHVRNFIKLAKSRFYDGLIFHRLVPGFVIQGGDPMGNGRGGPGYQINHEFNSRKHLEGTVAMARSRDPNSAGSQFYICLAPQPRLDGQYTVFGQLLEGMDVVHAIGKIPTSGQRPVRTVVDAEGQRLNIPLDQNGLPREGPLPAGARILDIPVMNKVYIEGL
jgi:cyclophilin family peptidyl-prolyl cis-trans isomerase